MADVNRKSVRHRSLSIRCKYRSHHISINFNLCQLCSFDSLRRDVFAVFCVRMYDCYYHHVPWLLLWNTPTHEDDRIRYACDKFTCDGRAKRVDIGTVYRRRQQRRHAHTHTWLLYCSLAPHMIYDRKHIKSNWVLCAVPSETHIRTVPPPPPPPCCIFRPGESGGRRNGVPVEWVSQLVRPASDRG